MRKIDITQINGVAITLFVLCTVGGIGMTQARRALSAVRDQGRAAVGEGRGVAIRKVLGAARAGTVSHHPHH